MKAPEKIYLTQLMLFAAPTISNSDKDIEYIRTDAFIEKAAKYLMDYEFNDSPTIADRKKRVEEFKNAMML